MKLSCLIYGDNQNKVNTIKKVLVKYCSPELEVHEMTRDEPESGILRFRPNIVILDVSVPFAETIRLLDRLRRCCQEAYFAVFVQYREFTFSNESMELENVEFLPYPVRSEMLQESVTRLVDHFHERKDQMMADKSLQSVVNDNIPIIRQHYLSMLLRTGIPESEDVRRKFATLRIECPGPCYTVIVADMPAERAKANYEAVSFLVLSALKSILKSEGYQVYVFFDSEYRINCLVGHGQKTPELSMETILDRFRDRVRLYMDVDPFIGVGDAVSAPNRIHASYDQAEIALRYALEGQSETMLFYKNIRETSRTELFVDQMTEKIARTFTVNTREATLSLIRDTLLELDAGSAGLREKRRFAIKCAYQLIAKSERSGIRTDELPEVHRCALMLLDAASEAQLGQHLEQLLSLLCQTERNRSDGGQRVMLLARQYIEEHLGESGLNLEMVSAHVGFSKSYFCRLFHDQQGESFSEYLKRRRLDRARQLLLKTGKKTYEIAAETGFRSSKYFSVVFREAEGISPSEYRSRKSGSFS